MISGPKFSGKKAYCHQYRYRMYMVPKIDFWYPPVHLDEKSIFELENRDENENLQIQNDQQIEIFNLNLTICWFERIFKFKNRKNEVCKNPKMYTKFIYNYI